MSGLIFEGDTTERFGKLFPKPFISEIRVFDNVIESDVMLFFEVPLDDDETATVLSNMRRNLFVFGVFFEQQQFNEVLNPNFTSEFSEFYKNSFFTLNLNENDYRKRFSTSNIEYEYNSVGKRFAKVLMTFSYPGYAAFVAMRKNRYFGAYTSFISPAEELGEGDTGHDALDSAFSQQKNLHNLYRNQTSDLVYEKIFNPDNTLNTGKVEAYEESDGNFYGKIPLQSLDRTYKKTDNVTPDAVFNLLSPIVAPYVGTAEGDRVSTTLSEYSNDPKLLLQLEKDINSFSNKSSTTNVGQFYNELVTAVTDIDNLLQPEETLTKRLAINSKIKDRRGDISLLSSNSGVAEDETNDFLTPSDFIYDDSILDSIEILQSTTGTVPEFVIQKKSFHFLDFAKLQNYKSKISDYFNPYNLQQIFGYNCLNSFFSIIQTKVRSADALHGQTGFIFTIQNPPNTEYTVEDTDNNGEFSIRDVTQPTHMSAQTEIYPYFIERKFGTNYGMLNYKLRCFEASELYKIDRFPNNYRYVTTHTITDETMQFYERFIRQKIQIAFNQLQEYVEFANEFCAYNNIDGRFNDFFIRQIKEQFSDPFPWIEAPVAYYNIFALYEASYEFLAGSLTRKKDGSLINLSSIRQQIQKTIVDISPDTGNLDSLNAFFEDMSSFVELFQKGQGIDEGETIYSDYNDSLGYDLKEPFVSLVVTTSSRIYSAAGRIAQSYETLPYIVITETWNDPDSAVIAYETFLDFRTRYRQRTVETGINNYHISTIINSLQWANDPNLTLEKLSLPNPYTDESMSYINNTHSSPNEPPRDAQGGVFIRKYLIPAYLKAKEISGNSNLTITEFLGGNDILNGSLKNILTEYYGQTYERGDTI